MADEPELEPELPKLIEYYSTAKVAEMLHVNVDTVRRWLNDGSIKGFRVGERGRFRISRAEFARFANERFPTAVNKGVPTT